ncbi:MAG: NAD(+)/NADH kinase [Candidatus Thorarchaeota archaeon]
MSIVSGNTSNMVEDADAIADLLNNGNFEIVQRDTINASSKTKGRDIYKSDPDILIVVGSDRTLLNALLSMGEESIPTLPVASRGHPGFLFDVTSSDFEQVLDDLSENRWTEDRRTRFFATIGKRRTPAFLNEIAIFPRRSATLLRYSLFLDDEEFWQDGSDGLIISTPTGSTAYAMSGGGPIVLHPAKVLNIVSVNSGNPARKPLVVSEEVRVDIRNLTSSVAIDAVIDGQTRIPIKNADVTVLRSPSDAIFVKFAEERVAAIQGKLMRKTEVRDEKTSELPPSAKLVLKVLEYQGSMTQKRIIEETNLPSRTVRYALSLLVSEALVRKQISLRDSRQALYSIKETKET